MMRRLWLLLLPIVLLFAGCDDETAYSYVGYYNVTMELYAVVRDANGVDHTVRASDKGEMYLDLDDVDGYVYTEGFINTTGWSRSRCPTWRPMSCCNTVSRGTMGGATWSGPLR